MQLNRPDIKPKLRTKVENLESKYLEFVNNCSNYMKTPSSSKRHEKNYPTERLDQKRGKSNEFLTENARLKRRNEILAKTVEELNKKVETLELYEHEHTLHQELDKKIRLKTNMLDKKEKEIEVLKQLIEKTIQKPNNIVTDRANCRASSTINKKTSKSPVCQMFMPKTREYSPIERKLIGTPISRNISPREKKNYNYKKQLEDTQQKLNKTIQERDLFKSWKKYCIENPPVPPAVQLIIGHYETEIKRIDYLNAITSYKTEKIVKAVKNLLAEIKTTSMSKKYPKIDNISNELVNIIKDILPNKPIQTIKIIKDSENKLNLFKISQDLYERENKDLEKILERETSRADYFSDLFNNKALEVAQLKQSFESLNYEKVNSSSAPVTVENFFDHKSFYNGPNFENEYFVAESYRIRAEVSRTENNFHAQMQEIFESLNKKTESIGKAFKKLEEVKLKLNFYQQSNQKLINSASKTQENLKTLVSEKEITDTELESAKDLIADYKSQIKVLTQNLEEANKQKELQDQFMETYQKPYKEVKILNKDSKNGKKLLRSSANTYNFSIVFENSVVVPSLADFQANYTNLKTLITQLTEEINEEVTSNTISTISDSLKQLEILKKTHSKTLKDYANLSEIKDNLSRSVLKYESDLKEISKEKYDALNFMELFQIQLRDLQKTNSDYKNSLETLLKSDSDKIKTVEILKNLNSDYLNKIDSLSKKILEYETIIDNLNCIDSDSKRIIQSLSNKNSEYITEIQQLYDSIGQYKNNLEDLSKTNADYSKKIENLSEANTNYFNTIENISKTHTDYIKAIEDLSKKNTECSKTIENLSETNTDYFNTIEDISKIHTNYIKAIEDLSKKNTEYSKTTEALSETNADYFNTIEELSKIHATYIKSIEDLSKKNTEYRKTIENILKTNNDYSERIETLSKANTDYAKTIETLSKTSNGCSESIETLSKPNTDHTKTIETLLKANTDYSQQIETLSKTNTEYSDTIETLSKKNTEYSDTIETLSKTNTEYSDMIETLSKINSEQKSLINTLSKANTEYSNTIDDLSKLNLKKSSSHNLKVHYCYDSSILIAAGKISSGSSRALLNYSKVQSHNLIRAESLEEMPEIIMRISSSTSNPETPEPVIDAAQDYELRLTGLLQSIQNLIPEKIPNQVIEWCKQVLGHDNYIFRSKASDSVVSDDSQSNLEDISIVSEVNSQEFNHQAHSKLASQKKTIDLLILRLKEKKERIRVSKLHIKALQTEIRNLDNKLHRENNLDLEYLRVSVLNFSKGLKKLDKDSFTMLQIIFSQLGLNIMELGIKVDKKKWGLFKKKE